MASKVAAARCLFVFILSALTSEAKGSIPVPRNLTATFVDPNEIHVSWQAPENVSKAFLGYNVILSSAGVTIVNTTVGNTSVSGSLELKDVCGNYTVEVAVYTASKQIGNYSSVVLLENCGPPKIYTKEFTMYAKEEEDVIIPCNHTGRPQPSVYWLTPSGRVEKGKQILHYSFDKQGNQISVAVIKLMENGWLSISFTEQRDSGNYTCYVNNSYGSASNTVTIKVFKEFAAVRFELTLMDEVFHADLQDRSSKLFQSFSTRFTKEVNEVLTGLSNDIQNHEVQIINIRNGSVIVDFRIVASFTSANLNKKISSEIWSLILNSANSGFLGNLTVSKIIVLADPPPPTNLEAINIGKDHVTIKWSAPAYAENFQISGYSVEMKGFVDDSSDYTEVATASKDQRAVEVKDLDSNSAEYLFQVLSHRPGEYDPGVSEPLEVMTAAGGLQGWAVALIVIFVLLVVAAVVFAAVLIWRRRREGGRRQFVIERRQNTYAFGPRRVTNEMQPLQVRLPQKGFERLWTEIPRDSIEVGEALGEGAFGVVMKGYMTRDGKTVPCAIKTVKQNFTENEVRDLFNEVNRMAAVGNHPNVVSLYGACSEGGPLWIVVKLAENGCLLNYLQKHRKQVYNDYQNVTVNPDYQNVEEGSGRLNYVQKLQLARGIARGMQHLERMKCVHRDLAARNILLGKNNVPMVSDFGLARDVYESGAYENTTGGKLPVRWMAIESLEDYIYTTQTDVWAYAVVLWEIETEGNIPYPGIGGGMEILKELKSGHRLSKPDECSDEMYGIMRECWEADPKKRPTFGKIVDKVEAIMSQETNYLELGDDQDLDKAPYDEVTLPSDRELSFSNEEERSVEITGLPPV